MELFDLYDVNRIPTGETMERGTPTPANRYRLVVHISVFNAKGELLIQQRQPFKKGFSNLWDLSVGGSVISGETSRAGAQRELYEELGLTADFQNSAPAVSITFDGGFDDHYILVRDVDISDLRLQYEEVQAARWATLEEILDMIDSGTFIPYHKSLIELLFFLRNHKGTHTK